MERLTDKKSRNPICSEQGGLCVSVKFVSRLAAYEDTGLEPEEIIGLCEINKRAKMTELLRLEEYQSLGTIDELSALVKARDEGRVHIAPIRDGTAIFYHIDDDENMFPEVMDGIFEGIYVNGHIEHLFGEMGVGWFLTRAEAKAALGGGRDG